MNDHTELAKMDFEYFFDLIITAAASVFYFTSYIYPTGWKNSPGKNVHVEDLMEDFWGLWIGIESMKKGDGREGHGVDYGSVGCTGKTEAGKGWDRKEEDHPLL